MSYPACFVSVLNLNKAVMYNIPKPKLSSTNFMLNIRVNTLTNNRLGIVGTLFVFSH